MGLIVDGGRFSGRFSGRGGGRFSRASDLGWLAGITPASGTLPVGALDFIGNRYVLGGSEATLGGMIVSSRPSTGWYFDAAGALQSAAADVARFTYDPVTLSPRGLLREPGRTNSVRNSTHQGASAGAPGTPPTNWTMTTPVIGVTREILSVSTVAGMQIMRVRWSGTVTSASLTRLFQVDSNTAIPIVSGNTSVTSAYLALASGSLGNLTQILLQHRLNDAGGVKTAETTTVSIAGLTSTLSRPFVAGTAVVDGFAAPQIVFSAPVNTVVDFTLDIGIWQTELGASAPSSPIPTSGSALLRAADVIRLTDGAAAQCIGAAGAWMVDFEADTAQLNNRVISTCNAAVPSFSEQLGTTFVGGGVTSYARAASAYTYLPSGQGVNTPPTRTKHAFKYEASSFWQATKGVLGTVQASGAYPATAQDRVYVGSLASSPGGSSDYLGCIAGLTFWNSALPSTDGAGLTT